MDLHIAPHLASLAETLRTQRIARPTLYSAIRNGRVRAYEVLGVLAIDQRDVAALVLQLDAARPRRHLNGKRSRVRAPAFAPPLAEGAP
jgi:hypothetical protein